PEAATFPLLRESSGCFTGFAEGVRAGARYKYRLDGGDAFPDPISRFQPLGVHGPSEVIDGHAFLWTDGGWQGVSLPRQVIYELHPGTFTQEGTWRAAIAELPALADLGITVIELMPIAEFAGRFGWGYDGVLWFAPFHEYGSPDDLRAFIDLAHALSLGVIL